MATSRRALALMAVLLLPYVAWGANNNPLLVGGPNALPSRPVGPVRRSAPSGAHLIYYGGRVVSNMQVVQVLWGSGSAGGGNGQYLAEVLGTTTPNIATFYQGVLNSAYVDWLDEYNTDITDFGGDSGTNQSIGRGSFSERVIITPSTNASSISDATIQTELVNQIVAGHLALPTTDAAGNNNTYYAIFFPHGKSITQGGATSCAAGGFCAYHGTVVASFPVGEIYYGVHPDMQAGSGCDTGCGSGATAFDNYTSVASHEMVETITDGEVGLAVDLAPPLAWYDNTNGEIGDICNAQQGSIVGSDGHTYTVQAEFSNAANTCIITASPTPTLTPTATATHTSTATATTTATGTATATATSGTPTATATRTATPTVTATATSTSTPTATATATGSATLTATATKTATPTATATQTPTATATATGTATATATSGTPTATATRTATPTVTATATSTSTPTATATATGSATLTATATKTATPTATATQTPTATATATSTGSATPTATRTATATATPTSTATATTTSTATATATQIATATATATSTATATVTPTPTPVAAPLKFTPRELNFKKVKVGNRKLQKLTLSNPTKSGPPITLANAIVSATNPQEFGFPKSGGYTCFLSVARLFPKQKCTLLLEFGPASTGPKFSSVTIMDNASNANQVIQLQGTGK